MTRRSNNRAGNEPASANTNNVLITQSLPLHLAERTRTLNDLPADESGEFVLYWMHHAARVDENPALEAAIYLANEQNKPLLVYQGLSGNHRFNSDRHHTFILEGARDVQMALREANIPYVFFLGRDPASQSPLRDLIDRAVLTITEDFPAPPFPRWVANHAQRSNAAFCVVDTVCIVPMQSLDKAYDRAFKFRKRTEAEFDSRLLEGWPTAPELKNKSSVETNFESIDFEKRDIAELVASCNIDHTIGPISHTPGGSNAGYARWSQFKADGLSSYARLRNDAAIDPPRGVSRMSAYLHHGHVSPFRIAREAAAANNAGANKFLDELLIWRELAHNFCFHHRDVESLAVLPKWAQDTLAKHAADRRREVYTWEQLARAATADDLWNAAQTSLLIHGELHNNLRMTWGKALLRWTESPEQALEYLIDLNHRYALDGNDPNSYGGLLWCLGLFDRAFPPEKAVLGTVRPRSTASHAARLDLEHYCDRVTQPVSGERLRVAVIGAGIAGLTAARTLQDQGHEVQLFDKGRGPGGRTSVRRTDGYEFDHGAQYFTARDARFQRLVESWCEAGIVAEWNARFVSIENGQIAAVERDTRYVGVPGANAIAKYLATDISVEFETRITNISRTKGKWNLTTDDDQSFDDFDRLTIAMPPAQAADLLAGVSPLVDQVQQAKMSPCWAVMLGFDKPIDVEFDAARIKGSPLSWIARNSAKPERDGGYAWILHASPDWSEAKLEQEKQTVIDALAEEFFAITDATKQKPAHASAHRWRYALAEDTLNCDALWDNDLGLAVCGDWCCSARVEGAFLSGAAAAGRILSSVYSQKPEPIRT